MPEEIRLTIDYHDDGIESDVLLKRIDGDTYQLEEIPILNESVEFKDHILLKKIDSKKYKFVKVVKKANYITEQAILSENRIDSNALNTLLNELNDKGVFWQRDFGGLLSVAYPKELEEFIRETFKQFNT